MGCISSKQVMLNASPAVERRRRRRLPPLLPKAAAGGGRGRGRGETHPDHASSISRSSSKYRHSGLLSFRDKEEDQDQDLRNKNRINSNYRLQERDNKLNENVEEEDQPQEDEEEHDNKAEEEKEQLEDEEELVCGRQLRTTVVRHRYVEAEHLAAGWPSWLSGTAAEAVHGWLPLRADAYEKLDKIGQGTYSSVFRAREVETGRILALKKVHFDNFQPESVRFMAREIMILRKLDHPNIIKLEGIITSRLSCNIYLVFEYMEHDLSGLLSSPDVKLNEAQIKCYMKQLLAGIEHCHMRGVMHRDIKASNILVNNQGVLKLGDFGLANILNSRNRHSLTSRVVTLWYRPPELLMGSTNYGVSVDLWSVGCVFAELLIGRPILKGRTEVEQLHKIFKLCGNPPEEYWKQSRLPLANMFKPQHTYESSLRERCKDFPSTAVNLIETLLSIEPYKRGTASSALISEYFMSKPFACEPSRLPKYPPNKEIDAKIREEARRKRAGNARDPTAKRKSRKGRKVLQDPNAVTKRREEVSENSLTTRRLNGSNIPKVANGRGAFREEMDASKEKSHFSGPVAITAPTSFTWASRRWNDDVTSSLSYSISCTDLISPVDSNKPVSKSSLGIPDKENGDMRYVSHEDPKERVEFSAPLLTESDIIDELLERNEMHIRWAVHEPRF